MRMTTKEPSEPFINRWSRLKEQARTEQQQAPEPAESEKARAGDAKGPPPELPPVERLTPDSDFRPFLDPRVDEDTRRAALKKLFADARFNVIDEMDVYIDDYTKADPIPPAMLAALKQAQNILEWAKGEKPASEQEAGRERERGEEPARIAEAGATPESQSGSLRELVPSRPEPEPVPLERTDSARKKA